MKNSFAHRRIFIGIIMVIFAIFVVTPVDAKHNNQNISSANLPPGYSLPTMSDRAITQGPTSCKPTHCQGTSDEGAIDIDVQETRFDDTRQNIDPIFAPAAGTIYNLTDTYYGNYVKIVHDNGVTTYLAHLKEFRRSNGERVFQGEMVGVGGSTGKNSTGSHVHWIVRPSDVGISNKSQGYVDITNIRGMSWSGTGKNTGMAHGPILLNDVSYVPIQDSNSILFSSDDQNIPDFLNYPYEIKVGKFWSVILFGQENYQGDWHYYQHFENYASIPLPVRSLRVYWATCPTPPNSLSIVQDQLVRFNSDNLKNVNVFDCNINPPPSTNDSAILISSITLPDGTTVTPGQALTKTWQMKNTGTSTWGSGYQLVFTEGESMGAPAAIDVPATAPNQTVNLSIPITAPSTAGLHQGYWRMRNPQGTYFGPKVWVKINVLSSASTRITLLETDPASPASTNKVRIHARVENFPNLRAVRVKIDGEVKGEIGAPEIWVDWNTAGYQNGAHSIVVEAASNADLNWVNPEVRGMTFILQGNASSTNHAPNPPTLTNPGDWAVYEEAGGINLSAQHNGDPDGDAVNQYYFEIYDSHDTPNSGWINSNSWSPPGLSIFGYQWRVKVRDQHGAESGWSETRHFTITDPNPQIYSFSSQTCRPAWNQGDPDKICFCAQTNAGTLQLQINSATDGSANGAWKIFNELGSSNYNCNLDSDSPPTLDPKELETGIHRVRLYARRDGGWAAAKTQDITISVGNLRPNGPIAQILTNGVYANSQNLTLAWQGTQRTTNYRVEVSQNSSFSTHLVDQTVPAAQTQLTISLASPFPDVYWRVTANGPYGSNSSTNLFHIDVNPPDTTLSVPSAVVFENNFPVNWSGADSASGIQQYHIQVLNQSRPEAAWSDWLVNTTQTAAIFTGQAGHTYLFRIRGMDKVGNWQAWPTANGSRQAVVEIDPASAPQTPWWNSAYEYKRNLTVLNNDSDWMPPHYPIHIQFNENTTPTASEIYNASLSSPRSNDVRVIFNNTTELDRVIQRFDSSQIDIWFPLQNGLGGGGTDSTGYQLYYGNASPGTPPSNTNAVFLPVSDGNTIGLWHFQEGSGTTVTDSSGRGHNGTFYGAGWGTGLMGRAGYFDGANSHVDMGNSNDFNLASGPMTLEAWIYLTSAGNFPIILSKDGPGDGSYFFRLMGGARNLQFWARSGGEVVTGEIIQINRWYHVAATYDGSSTMRIFVNGSQYASRTGVTDGLSSARRFFVGWADSVTGDSHFPGYIQHVRVSNVERTDFSYARIDIQPSLVAGLQQTVPVAGNPDLVVQSLNTYPNPGGGVLVEAVVYNQGTVSTTNGFYTDLYINHLPTGAGDYTGSLKFWVNDPIPANGSANLTAVITELDGSGTTMAASGSPVETSGTIYVQTDSTGAIAEPDKQNNIYSTGASICLAQPDEFETDDTFNTAPTLALGVSQIHNFDKMGDQDWIKFVATAGKTYLLSTSLLGASSDTYLYLYDTDGTTLLASNDDFGDTLASQIEWQAPASGTYYILVNNWNPNVGGCGTKYAVSVNTAGVSISGNVGTAGATLNYTDGTPKNATADGSGDYAITVPSGWSGTVTPSKAGHVFTPASRTYANVTTNQANQDYWVTFPAEWAGGLSLTSDQPVVAVGRPHVGAEVMTYNGFGSGSTTMYVPMLFKNAFGGSYSAALYLQNISDTTAANVSISYYDSTGALTCSVTNETLTPLAIKGYWLPTVSCLPVGWVGGAVVTSDEPIVAVGRPHVGSQVTTYAGFASGSLSMYAPMLFKNAFGGGYNAALYIQNTDAALSATVDIEFYDSAGSLTCALTGEAIAALATKGYWIPSISCLPVGWVGGAVITSDQPIVAVGRPHIGSQVTTYNGFSAGSASLRVPMLFKNAFAGGTYNAALYIQNTDPALAATVDIDFYDSNGSLTCSLTGESVAALATKGYWMPSVACLPVGWVGGAVITANRDVVAVGRPHVGAEVATYGGFTAGSTEMYLPMLFKDAFGGSYDSAVYVQNTSGGNSANVTFKFYDTLGNLSCLKTASIPAGATVGYWLPTLTCTP